MGSSKRKQRSEGSSVTCPVATDIRKKERTAANCAALDGQGNISSEIEPEIEPKDLQANCNQTRTEDARPSAPVSDSSCLTKVLNQTSFFDAGKLIEYYNNYAIECLVIQNAKFRV